VIDRIRAAREELMQVGLLGDVDVNGVPDLVVRSWRRSISSSADSAQVSQRFQDVDTESVLVRGASPVLERWDHQLADTGTSLFLCDRSGKIVSRHTGDNGVRRHLDEVNAAEGFDYSEESIGTNGLGTSIVEKRPVWIQGTQHYNDTLADLACAAVPVTAPTGFIIGSISLGGPVKNASPLMMSLTREIGKQIDEQMRANARPQDLAMAMSFMRFSNSQRPTVVMDKESMLANTPGLPYVSVDSHVMLWEILNARSWEREAHARISLEMLGVDAVATRVIDGPATHFVLHFVPAPRMDADLPSRTPASLSSLGPSLHDAVVVVEGPAGSGRATHARSIHAGYDESTELHVVTVDPTAPVPWNAVGELLAGNADVLVKRLEGLTADGVEQVRRLALEHKAAYSEGKRRNLFLLTASKQGASAELVELVDVLGMSSSTKPLAQTPERIPGLVKRLLDLADPGGRTTFSPAALQAFVQWSWPRNISELSDTITEIVRRVPAAVIERRHLPQHLQQALPRRPLTLIEAAERGAIIRALEAAEGNKKEAAQLLGLGRTTLYRRLRQLGLDVGEDAL
jgi:transcriptional regulator of acetoin/glycerol metabolism